MVNSKGKPQPATAEAPKPSDDETTPASSVDSSPVTENAGVIRNVVARAGGYVDYGDGRGWILEVNDGEPSDH